YWIIEGERYPVFMVDGAAGRPPHEWIRAPQRFDEFRAGVTDPDARVADMDLNGTWASMGFPSGNFGFAGSRFVKMQDRGLAYAAVRGYNDWMLEEWCGSNPDRFIPMQLAWLGDPAEAVDELERNAARGCRSVSFSENPAGLGLASIYSGEWDPFLAACEDTG